MDNFSGYKYVQPQLLQFKLILIRLASHINNAIEAKMSFYTHSYIGCKRIVLNKDKHISVYTRKQHRK